jgi:hypothetical protein
MAAGYCYATDPLFVVGFSASVSAQLIQGSYQTPTSNKRKVVQLPFLRF